MPYPTEDMWFVHPLEVNETRTLATKVLVDQLSKRDFSLIAPDTIGSFIGKEAAEAWARDRYGNEVEIVYEDPRYELYPWARPR